MRANRVVCSGERSLQVTPPVAEKRSAPRCRSKRPGSIEPAPALLELHYKLGCFVEPTEPDERLDLVRMKAKGDHGRLAEGSSGEIPAKRPELGFGGFEVAERKLEEARDRPELKLGGTHSGLGCERTPFLDDFSGDVDASSIRREERFRGQRKRALRLLCVPERRRDRFIDEALGTTSPRFAGFLKPRTRNRPVWPMCAGARRSLGQTV